MTLLDELTNYSKACAKDNKRNGKKHIWACARFLEDLDRIGSDDFPYIWNEQEAISIVIFSRFLRHTKGILAGKEIELTIWQKFILCQIYGWRHKETGYKRFRKSFIEVGRKNAKSQMEGIIALYEISTQSIKNGEIYETYCAGVKKDQSKIVFNECDNMLRGLDTRKKFKITKSEIAHRKSGSFLKPLTKEDGQKGDGTNPALLIIDEYHQHPTTEFYDLGLGSQSKESLLMIITTAGLDLNAPCYTQEYKLCSRILDPRCETKMDTYFIDICEIDEEDDFTDIECWYKANPIRMSYNEGIDVLKEAFALTQEKPETRTTFLTKCLNRWVQAKADSYMDMGKWRECEVNTIKDLGVDINGKSAYIGFDLSSKIDLSSVSIIIPYKEKEKVKYALLSHSFIPNQKRLKEHEFNERQPYKMWEKGGHITVMNVPVIDQLEILKWVEAFIKKYNLKIEMLCFDESHAGTAMLEFEKLGYKVTHIHQSKRALNFATVEFRNCIYSGSIEYVKNPVLTYAMGNATTEYSDGLIKIDKKKKKERVDPVDASLFAFKLALFHNFDRGNLFEEMYDMLVKQRV